MFGLRHAGSDCFRDRRVATITPQPLRVGEIGTQSRARRVRAMAARAGRSADLTMVDAIAQRNHLLGRAGGHGKTCGRGGGAGIGMSAFRRFGVIDADLAGGCRCAWTGSEIAGAAGSA